jgi:hypothetical protein
LEKNNIFRWFLLEIPNRTDLFLFINRTFNPHIWSTHLIHTFDPHIWSTHLIHTFDPHIWSTHLIHTFDPHIWSTHLIHTLTFHFQKYKGIWTSNPSHEFQDWPKKYSFLETGPRFISYRLSHKWAKLVNPLKTSSCDRRTDRQTDGKVRTIAYENTLKNKWA